MPDPREIVKDSINRMGFIHLHYSGSQWWLNTREDRTNICEMEPHRCLHLSLHLPVGVVILGYRGKA